MVREDPRRCADSRDCWWSTCPTDSPGSRPASCSPTSAPRSSSRTTGRQRAARPAGLSRSWPRGRRASCSTCTTPTDAAVAARWPRAPTWSSRRSGRAWPSGSGSATRSCAAQPRARVRLDHRLRPHRAVGRRAGLRGHRHGQARRVRRDRRHDRTPGPVVPVGAVLRPTRPPSCSPRASWPRSSSASAAVSASGSTRPWRQGLTVHDTFNWFSRVIAARYRGAFSQTPLSVEGRAERRAVVPPADRTHRRTGGGCSSRRPRSGCSGP